ncbi:uncharacterized protein FIBRA_04194 [Fibroporia radiculosa]|uniref:XPG-I domain-containing protein n=1 Tax=Fibroporia radiculosa TaxID=599839 RepID=J4HWE4_9APHY|nr:uncharacterized protein FIBRA_04194 [Fibroporia radiculosa]CCM02117.1 predicted protein [Fibroporia radiculosa]
MGVAGLWDILRPAGETRSLTHLAVVDGFEANPQGVRGFRVGIDASIWFFHAAYGREGENPELRTLFFKCTRLMSAPFLPLFVFDGPKRPEVKRGKRISGKHHWMVQGMQRIIDAFGFEWRMAPGEAEAELAYLNRIGIIDAVYTDDVDTFLFGAKMILRNPSVTLSGNRAHSLKNGAGRDDGNHAATYTSHNILNHPSVQLTQGGLILIGILRGGDYHQAGLQGCGGTIAHGLAKCGFGDSLLRAAQTLSREKLSEFLDTWREELRVELRTNARGLIGKKYPSLAKSIPSDFPDIEVLLNYTDPITSESNSTRPKKIFIDWEKEPDLGKIAELCELYFEWGVKEIIIKRFRTVLWPAAVLRILRRAALLRDKKATRIGINSSQPPSTPTKSGRPRPVPGTPSSMIVKHFSELQLGTPTRKGKIDSDDEQDEEEPLIVKIHSSRKHATTDGVLEYRLEIAPAQLVRLCESGIKGLRHEVVTGLDDSNDTTDDDDEDAPRGKKTKKPPPEPESHLRIWLPACMVRIVEPELVDEFEGIQEMRQAKKAGKSMRAPRASKPKALPAKVKNISRSANDGAESEDDMVLPIPKRKPRIKPSVVQIEDAIKQDFFPPEKVPPKAKKAASATGKIAALFSQSDTIHEIDLGDSSLHEYAGRSRSKKPVRKPSVASSSSSSSANSKATSTRYTTPSPPKSRFVPAPFPLSFDDDLPSRPTQGVKQADIDLANPSMQHTRSTTPPSPPKFIPAPFPLLFDDNHPLHSTRASGQNSVRSVDRPRSSTPIRSRNLSPPTSDVDSPCSSVHKSPRKSQEHTSPRSKSPTHRAPDASDSDRAVSPSPMRSRPVMPALKLTSSPSRSKWNRSIIEISSDSDSEVVLKLKATKKPLKPVKPLAVARAMSTSATVRLPASVAGAPSGSTEKTGSSRSRPKYTEPSNSDNVIDLT